MVDSVTKIVGTATDEARAGASKSWSNLSRITANDDSFSANGSGDLDGIVYTDYIVGTMTGNVFAIPTTKVIVGVECNFEHKVNGIEGGQQVVSSLIVVSSLGNGTDYSDSIDIRSETPVLRTRGSPTELWGLALTPAVVNAGSFGFKLSIGNPVGGNAKRAEIDYFSITVYYDDPPADIQPIMELVA